MQAGFTFQLRREQFETNLSATQMKPPAQSTPQNQTDSLSGLLVPLASGLTLVSFALVLATLLVPLNLPGNPGWPEALLLLSATILTLATLASQLPAQNVFLAATGIAFIGCIAHGVGAATAIPFGLFTFTANAGPQLLNTLPWFVPFIWVIAVLNSRGVARLILRPWRKMRAYGFWLIGVTVMLTVTFGAALEPFASRVKHYWLWSPTNLPFTWHGAPVTNFLGWLLVSLLILAFVTPALINKNPKKSPPDYRPLVTWVLFDVLFAVGAATRELWTAVILCAVSALIVSAAAIHGAKW
jgi:uncharacterized membrane protein